MQYHPNDRNINVIDQKKYDYKMVNAATLASEFRQRAITYSVNLYGKHRNVVSFDSVVM